MSAPLWSTPAGDLGTIPELNYFALDLEARDSQDLSNPILFELIAGTTSAGMHVDGRGSVAGSPQIMTSNIKEDTSKFAVRARASDYYEEFINDGSTFTFTTPVTVDIVRVVAIINGTEILEPTFSKSETNMFTFTLPRPLVSGEVAAVSLYRFAAPSPDYQEEVIGDGITTTYILSETIGFTAARVVTLVNGNIIRSSAYSKSLSGIFTVVMSEPVESGDVLTISLYQAAAPNPSYSANFSIVDVRSQIVLSDYINFDIYKVLAVANGNEIRSCTYKKTSAGVVTVTLYIPLTVGEIVVISAFRSDAAVSDRTFSVTVVGENPPSILKYDPLGTYFDGQFIDIDITALDLDPDDTLTWDLTAGKLPDGVTLDRNTGKLSGYIVPFYVSGTQVSIIDYIGFDAVPFDSFVYDDTTPTTSYFSVTSPGTDVFANYQFTISVSDGKFSDAKTYNLRVISSSDVIASTDQITVDSTTFTADQKKIYSPIMLNTAGEIGPFQHDN